ICLGVLRGRPRSSTSLCIDIGGGSSEIALAQGEVPLKLWSVALGAVRLTELFRTSGFVSKKTLKLVRQYAQEMLAEELPRRAGSWPRKAFGSSGTIGAVVRFASDGEYIATRKQLKKATQRLVSMSVQERRQIFDDRRADIIVAGAVILES